MATFLLVVSICCFILILSSNFFLELSNNLCKCLCLFNHIICADFDPVGVVCSIDKGELNNGEGVYNEILLNDEDHLLYNLVLNFRSKSQILILSFGPFKEFLTPFFV